MESGTVVFDKLTKTNVKFVRFEQGISKQYVIVEVRGNEELRYLNEIVFGVNDPNRLMTQ